MRQSVFTSRYITSKGKDMTILKNRLSRAVLTRSPISALVILLLVQAGLSSLSHAYAQTTSVAHDGRSGSHALNRPIFVPPPFVNGDPLFTNTGNSNKTAGTTLTIGADIGWRSPP